MTTKRKPTALSRARTEATVLRTERDRVEVSLAGARERSIWWQESAEGLVKERNAALAQLAVLEQESLAASTRAEQAEHELRDAREQLAEIKPYDPHLLDLLRILLTRETARLG